MTLFKQGFRSGSSRTSCLPLASTAHIFEKAEQLRLDFLKRISQNVSNVQEDTIKRATPCSTNNVKAAGVMHCVRLVVSHCRVFERVRPRYD